MTGWSGCQVWTRARPGFSPRPARPVTCCSIWKVRSAARGSPEVRPISASSTPTRVMSGKLWPLATSWVPMTMSNSPAAMAASSARSRSVPPGKSLESTMQRLSGKQLGRLLGDALDAGTAGDQRIDAAAGDAGMRACAPHGRNGGRPASGGSGAPPARPSSSGIRSDGRRPGRGSAAHSRAG